MSKELTTLLSQAEPTSLAYCGLDRTSMWDNRTLDSWNDMRVALLGNAAHPMAAQYDPTAVNMTIEDAVCLASTIGFSPYDFSAKEAGDNMHEQYYGTRAEIDFGELLYIEEKLLHKTASGFTGAVRNILARFLARRGGQASQQGERWRKHFTVLERDLGYYRSIPRPSTESKPSNHNTTSSPDSS